MKKETIREFKCLIAKMLYICGALFFLSGLIIGFEESLKTGFQWFNLNYYKNHMGSTLAAILTIVTLNFAYTLHKDSESHSPE